MNQSGMASRRARRGTGVPASWHTSGGVPATSTGGAAMFQIVSAPPAAS